MNLRSFGPCDPDELAKLEAVLRIEFPREYRAWLLETNGGVAEDQPYFPMDGRPAGDEETLRDLLGIVPSQPTHDIAATIHEHLWILRQDHVPIGWCEGSSMLSISLTTWSDAIYLFEAFGESELNGLREPVYVADSIHHFISLLQTD